MQTPMLEKPMALPVLETQDSVQQVPSSCWAEIAAPKAAALRRAATAMLIFGMLCARPCPSSWGAWLACVAAISVLCAQPSKLLCRSRLVRLLSIFVAIFAGYTAMSLVVSFRAGMPLQISTKVHAECVDMPSDTFAWAQRKLGESGGHKGLAFLSRHMPNDTSTVPAFHISAQNTSSYPIGGPETWTQAQACYMIAHIVTCATKFVMIGSALAHLFLFLSAITVIKRVICLRCAAYRAGVLTWKCGARCKSKCSHTEQAAVATSPAPAAKEMA